MKIALCFCGQARSFESGYEYYKRNLLDHYDVDVYIHSWKFPESNKLLQLYKPKDYLFEDKLMGDYDKIYTNTPNAQRLLDYRRRSAHGRQPPQRNSV